MANVSALPEPADETGLRAAVMRAARLACGHSEIAAFAFVALHEDGSRTVAGSLSCALPDVVNEPLFIAMVAEDVRSHFMTAPEVERLMTDGEC